MKLTHMYLKCACLMVLLLTTGMAHAQFPLEVQVNVMPPYPTRLSDFTSIESNVLITIQNNTQSTYNKVYLHGVLQNETTGATISTDPNIIPRACIDIPPGSTMLTGVDLRELFNPDNLIYRGVNQEQIRGDQALPEGRYTLCIRVRECEGSRRFLSDIPTEPFGCAGFDVQYVDPPVIIAPMCEEMVSTDQIAIPIVWTWMPPVGGYTSVNFNIRIVEIEPVTRNPFDAMQSSPPVFVTDVENVTSYNLTIPDDVLLEVGRKYAIQITASDEDGRITFKNNGKSTICTFTYGTAGGSGSFQRVIPVYPADGDVIPFSYFPFIVKYENYSNQYNHFRSDFTLSSDTRGTEDTHRRDLNWGRGPRESQERATGFSMTELQAQHIAVYKNQTDASPFDFTADKKKNYSWRARIEIDEGTTTHTADIPDVDFKVGMGPSDLKLPANNDTVPPGNIRFQWESAKAPTKLLPGMDIVQADRSTGRVPTFFNGFVDERWVIEVSRTESFVDILHTMSGRVGGTFDLFSDEGEIRGALYKDLEENFTITEEGRYYWRVRWMVAADNPGNNESYATSPVFNFVIDSDAPSGPPVASDTPEDDGACTSNCIPEEITDRTAVGGLAVGSDVTVGKFTLNVRSITSSSSNQYTGEGVITIPFLNNVKILVEFTNIRMNAARKVFSGTVKAKADRTFVTEEVRTRMGEVLSMSDTEAEALHSFIDDGDRLASFFSGSREIGMPIGIDKEIDGKKYIIGITNIEFAPERATLDAMMRLDLPEIGDYIIALGVKDLCINPNGLGDEGRLYLARDLLVVQEGETRFAFKGSETADTTQATYVSWDCRGFKCMQVRGEVTFPRSMFVPDNADGTAGEGNVKGTFGVKTCRGGNWIASIGFDPFQVAGLEGWGWNTTTAYLDFSDVENPPGFRLPRNYGDTTLLDSRLVSTWKGFYIERIQLRLPPEFANDVTPDARTAFGVHNVIIDRTGLTASIRAVNILEVSEGNFEGWGFAIDTVNIDFVSNTFTEAGMAGRIGMPIFDEGDNLRYRMALNYSDSRGEFSYQFRVYTRDTLNIPMWDKAEMFFKPNSSIEIGINTPDRGTHATATLNGGIHLVGDFGAVPGVNFKGINFEGLWLSTRANDEGKYFEADSIYIAHASPQKSASGFPVNIDNVNLNLSNPGRPGIEFDFQLVFSEGSTSIGAEARFGVFARFEKRDGNFDVRFDGVDVGAISIDVSVSAMTLQGELEFYKDDPVYGNGTRGSLTVTLPMNISGSLTAYFGTYGSASRGSFGSREYYPYWLVDGMITFPGLPIFSGFAIYGFGGGAYYHMTMDDRSLPDPQATTSGSGRTSIRYIPSFDTSLGLKFTAVFGTHPSSEAFNMDVRLSAEFNNSFGLNFISVGGDGYFMASISERGDAKVWATVNMMFDNRPAEGPKFTGNFDVYVRVGEFLYGAGAGSKFVALEMYADRDTWHIYMGTPENRSGLIADVKVIQARLTSYLMVGHGIPVALPPLPDRIRSVLGGSGGRLEDEASTSAAASSRTRSASDEAAYRSGEGFAFGTALALDADFNLGLFYAILGLDLGFDLNFSKPRPGSVFCAETGAPPRGIDGWYIQGQVFAGLYGEMGVQVDLFFVKGRFPFIQLAAAAVMQGNFPDPSGFRGRAALQYSVLGGLVEGRCSFEMSIGEKCTMVVPNPLSGMDFIADIVPSNGAHDQSCFSSPAVSFNLPVEKFLEFPVEAADGSTYTRTFFPYIDRFEFIKTGSSAVQGRREFESNNTVLKFTLDEMLVGNSDYDVRVVIKAREHFANGTTQLVRNADGSVWQEERSLRFTTGPEPDYIPLDQVVYTYPVEGQYYFLKNEGARRVAASKAGGAPAGKTSTTSNSFGSSSSAMTTVQLDGVMQLLNPVNRVFRTEIDGQQYRYLVRYIPVSGGEKIERDLTYSTGRVMTLPMPPLDNETMYAVQLVRKVIPQRRDALTIAGEEVRRAEHDRYGISRMLASATIREAMGGALRVRVTGQNLVPGETVDVGEKLLYKFYFRTSRYNTLADKLNSINLTSTYRNLIIAEAFEVGAYLDEPFDEFEVNGLYKNGSQVMKPMLSLIDPFTYNYHTSVAEPGIYDLHSEFRTMLNRLLRRPSFTSLNSHQKGFPPKQTITVSDDSQIADAIERWQIEREARRNPEYNQSTTTTTNTTLAVQQHNAYGAAASVFNSGSPYRISTVALQSSGPRPNFEFNFTTSAYVWVDMIRLKQSVTYAMNWRPSIFSPYPVQQALNSNAALRNKVNTLLRQNVVNYRYTRGTYGMQFQYLIPRGNHSYLNGTNTTKTFSY